MCVSMPPWPGLICTDDHLRSMTSSHLSSASSAPCRVAKRAELQCARRRTTQRSPQERRRGSTDAARDLRSRLYMPVSVNSSARKLDDRKERQTCAPHLLYHLRQKMSSTAAVRPGTRNAARAGEVECAPPPTCTTVVRSFQAGPTLSYAAFGSHDEHLDDVEAAAG